MRDFFFIFFFFHELLMSDAMFMEAGLMEPSCWDNDALPLVLAADVVWPTAIKTGYDNEMSAHGQQFFFLFFFFFFCLRVSVS